MIKVLQITVEHYLTFAGQKSYTIFTPFKHCKKYIVNLSIWPVHWDYAKKFKHFLKLNHDVPKKVDDETFVGKTGKVSL